MHQANEVMVLICLSLVCFSLVIIGLLFLLIIYIVKRYRYYSISKIIKSKYNNKELSMLPFSESHMSVFDSCVVIFRCTNEYNNTIFSLIKYKNKNDYLITEC